jgi:branched-chain amino acid transport system ATP-binding protein
MAPIIELRDIYVSYGKIQAVRGVSFQLDEGSIVALMGANGAGKSTILKAIMGIKELSRGEILFAGERVGGKSTPDIVRMGVALCPEGRKIFPEMSVMKNLIAGAYLRKDKTEITRQLKEIFEYFPILRERHLQRGGSLSGGEQQMLAVGEPHGEPCCVLDELRLAPYCSRGRHYYKRYVKRHIHDFGGAKCLWSLEVSQHGFVMETGKIVMQGNYEELVVNRYYESLFR